ncbi:1-phosphofructokinase [Caldicellulosiruptoraceae bacterium PP1]
MKHILTVTLNPAIDKTITLEKFNLGTLNRVKEIKIDPGGKGINVAKVLKKFGMNVLATGLIAGKQGQLLLDYLNKANINNDFFIIEGETRTNIKIFDEHTSTITEINEQGFYVNEKDIEKFIDKFTKLLDNTSLLILSGSLPLGLDSKIYYELIQIANKKGVYTILDADGDALRYGINGIPYAIKPNINELNGLFNVNLQDSRDIIKVSKQLIELGIKIILVSNSEKGAYLITTANAYKINTFRIDCKSSVGAGDSMVATLAYCLINNFNIFEIAKWVTAAGTITASKPGTEVCSIEEVKKSLDLINVEDLSCWL